MAVAMGAVWAADPSPIIHPGAGNPGSAAISAFKRADVAEFDRLRGQSNAVVLDVRTPEEFAAGHLPGAGLLDIKGTNFLSALNNLDRSKLYLVNCAAGGRSSRACQNLSTLGFSNVVNLEGGFTAWKKAKPDAISYAPAEQLPQASKRTMHLHGAPGTPATPGSSTVPKPAPAP